MNDDGIICKAHSNSDYQEVIPDNSFRTTLTFYSTNQSNDDISLMLIYVGDENTRVHLYYR